MYKVHRKNLRFALVSLVILAVLIPQLGMMARPVVSFIPQLAIIWEPVVSWPFLTYGMYRNPHYEGDEISRRLLVGTLEDSTEVLIRPQDVGLGITLFHLHFIDALASDDNESIIKMADSYERRQNKRLMRLSLEERTWVLSGGRVEPGPSRVLKSVSLKSLRRAK